MPLMADIRRRIERVIEADPVIKKGLQRGIVNSRALARYIRDTEDVDSTPDAILGIIRRYPLSDGESSDIRHIFKGCELSLRNKIGELEVRYHPDTMRLVTEFASNHRTARGENVKLVLGLRFIRIIAGQNALESFRKSLHPGEITAYSEDLTEITVHLPPAAHTTKGIVAKVTTELFLNDINLAGIVECAPELTLVVADKDASLALEALQRMLKEDAANPKHGSTPSAPIRDSRTVVHA
ncbi:MAG TPA: hypothetical protein VKA28_05960 [Candidatus Bathyarchaeia archaeon]|nr:hypothetical protein [Candidatus Bathyarchaeia archaeon]